AFRLRERHKLEQLRPTVRQVLAHFDDLCRWEKELEFLLGKQRRALLERRVQEVNPEELARIERDRWQLGIRPVPDLRGHLERIGIRTFELEVPGGEFSGFSWWHEEYGPCILVNAKDIKGRRVFTFAHEYAHILRPDQPSLCDLSLDVPEERFADRFAVSFLMPAADLSAQFERRPIMGTTPDAQEIGRLAKRYGVSLEALGRRLEELELLPFGTTASLLSQWQVSRQDFGGVKGPRWWRQLGQPYVSLALEAYRSGHISLSRLALYLGLDVRKALQAVQQTEGGG
ncbi:MAG: ImmA/IrrE family metallo-endopeptidase, partial [Anaerolineae bacterium]